MTYPLLKFVHLLGLTLMGAGLIGIWYADLRSRQVHELPLLAEAIRTIAVCSTTAWSCRAPCYSSAPGPG